MVKSPGHRGTPTAMKPRILRGDPHIVPDARDEAYLAVAWERKRSRTWGIQVGDFVRLLNGVIVRATYVTDTRVQTASRNSGSYHLTWCGGMSYSGGLDPGIAKNLIRPTGEFLLGYAWFFHHDLPQAFSAVHAEIPCRLYEERV